MSSAWSVGQRGTVMATGEEIIILDRRTVKVEDGEVKEYFVHIPNSGNVWLDERKLLVTGLSELEGNELYWRFKGEGMDEDKILAILSRHNFPNGDDIERAFILQYGMSPDTAAELKQVQDSINAAMRAGRFDCI